jgi:hypothetical protein
MAVVPRSGIGRRIGREITANAMMADDLLLMAALLVEAELITPLLRSGDQLETTGGRVELNDSVERDERRSGTVVAQRVAIGVSVVAESPTSCSSTISTSGDPLVIGSNRIPWGNCIHLMHCSFGILPAGRKTKAAVACVWSGFTLNVLMRQMHSSHDDMFIVNA